jgi:glycosyltransferase involved in cell wall biosynthesis
VGPEDAQALLEAWLAGVGLELRGRGLISYLQADDFSHAELYRRARRIHDRGLRRAVRAGTAAVAGGDPGAAVGSLFEALVPAIPYAPATAVLGAAKAKLRDRGGERPRVAILADGIGAMHGVTHTIEQIRERGVPGFEVEVVGTDADVDRRLSSVAEIEVPFYRGLQIGVPGLPAIVEALSDGRYDIVHLCSPGAAGIGAWLLARVLSLPVVGSYHTELARYAGVRSGSDRLQAMTGLAVGGFYGSCDVVLSPSPATDAGLVELGIDERRIARWDRGVDLGRFDPSLRVPGLFPGEVNVLYAGRLTSEKGVGLLADAFESARAQDPRLHLVLAGGGPEEEALRARLGEHATFLGWLGGDELPRAYASADAFLFASVTDTFGQVILEAQASGLPVAAVGVGGPASLIADGETGMLAGPGADELAAALLAIVWTPLLAERLRKTALAAVRQRSWESSLAQLAAGYRSALLRSGGSGRGVRVA